MPELPDITVYVERLEALLRGEPLVECTLHNPFLLRSVDPPPDALLGRRITSVHAIGKRIVIAFEGDVALAIHLMIAGRLHWIPTGARAGRKPLASWSFPSGTLTLTEAGTTRRASVLVVRGKAGLAALDRGGLDLLRASPGEFAARLRSENHTIKRALTDPRMLRGIGNAYSDEILHRARLSPLVLTSRIDDNTMNRLYDATRDTLREWTERLRREAGDGFPEHVTAFREGMAVHGRFGLPCPVCGAPVQRIRYASNETNYCARCQTEGRLLADRALSRLLREDWPRSIDEIE